MKIALWTTLLEPLATEPKICISRDEHRYALSEERALSRPVFRLWKPTSLMLYSPEDLLSKLTVPPSKTSPSRAPITGRPVRLCPRRGVASRTSWSWPVAAQHVANLVVGPPPQRPVAAHRRLHRNLSRQHPRLRPPRPGSTASCGLILSCLLYVLEQRTPLLSAPLAAACRKTEELRHGWCSAPLYCYFAAGRVLCSVRLLECHFFFWWWWW